MIIFAAVIAALSAAVFALAERAPTLPASLGDPPVPAGSAIPLRRALHIARRALVVTSGVCMGLSLQWWTGSVTDIAMSVSLGTVLIYLVADAVPRALATLAPASAIAVIPIARTGLVAFRPLVSLMAAADRSAHRVFPTDRESAGTLGNVEREMLEGVRSLRTTTVDDVMTPRPDVEALDATLNWHEVIEFIRRSEHSRIPVYREGLDDIVGLLHAKDVAPLAAGYREAPASWHTLLRPVHYVPEARTLGAQLRDFQRRAPHLAIVVDEFGGTSGLLTLEDILEEIVGEIHDEHDVEEAPRIEREGDEFWVDGSVPLDELSVELEYPLERDDVATVGGLIVTELGRIPRPGEELRIGRFRIVVEQVARRRIRRVYFERLGTDFMASAETEVSRE